MKWCPIALCDCPVPEKYVMCREHWKLVPGELQRRIWRLWNNGKPNDGHLEACTQAIGTVNEQVQRSAQERLSVASEVPSRSHSGKEEP